MIRLLGIKKILGLLRGLDITVIENLPEDRRVLVQVIRNVFRDFLQHVPFVFRIFH
jgi:hypothetical protein